MQTIKISFICIFVFLYAIIIATAIAQEDVRDKIVLVKSNERKSTGFFWKDGKTIITTFHSLSDSKNIEVYIPTIKDWKKATLKKVYKSGDLALLKISDYSSSNFITNCYYNRPSTGTNCFTLGYDSGNPNYLSRVFTVGVSQINTLEGILPVTSRKEVRRLGFPSLSTEVVYLEGNLLHGFSGAPIVDSKGKLIGIADGGLENGASAISWCIHAKYLSNLENSDDELTVQSKTLIDNLFGSEEYTNNESDNYYVIINEFKFKKTKTRSFAQLDMTGKYSSIDSLGLMQLLNNFRGFNYLSFQYDIYLEETSGATIVIPTNDELKIEDGILVSGNEKMRLYIYIEKTTNPQLASIQFEKTIMTNPLYWNIDQVWTYRQAFPGPNNSVVRRRAYFYLDNFNKNYLFETLTANNQYFFGVATKRNDFLMSSPNDWINWAKYAIAIQLATFSN